MGAQRPRDATLFGKNSNALSIICKNEKIKKLDRAPFNSYEDLLKNRTLNGFDYLKEFRRHPNLPELLLTKSRISSLIPHLLTEIQWSSRTWQKVNNKFFLYSAHREKRILKRGI